MSVYYLSKYSAAVGIYMATSRRVSRRNKKHTILHATRYTKILESKFREQILYSPLSNRTQENVTQYFQEKVHLTVQNLSTTTTDSTHLCLQIQLA